MMLLDFHENEDINASFNIGNIAKEALKTAGIL